MPVGPTRCRIDVTEAHPESPARDAMMAGVFGRLLTITGARSVDAIIEQLAELHGKLRAAVG